MISYQLMVHYPLVTILSVVTTSTITVTDVRVKVLKLTSLWPGHFVLLQGFNNSIGNVYPWMLLPCHHILLHGYILSRFILSVSSIHKGNISIPTISRGTIGLPVGPGSRTVLQRGGTFLQWDGFTVRN